MTDIAPHLTAYLRQRLPVERAASLHTCDTYAYAFQLLLHFASEKLLMPPSALQLEHLVPPLGARVPGVPTTGARQCAAYAQRAAERYQVVHAFC